MMTEQETGVPTEVADRLRFIADRDGELTASAVVDDARNATSPLRSHFEWDDKVAAHEHRLTQAQELIRRVKITVTSEPDKPPIRVRAWISERDLGESKKPGTYRAAETVRATPAFQASLRDQMKRDIRRLQRKYQDWEAFVSLAASV
jgi:hypothetical protein